MIQIPHNDKVFSSIQCIYRITLQQTPCCNLSNLQPHILPHLSFAMHILFHHISHYFSLVNQFPFLVYQLFILLHSTLRHFLLPSYSLHFYRCSFFPFVKCSLSVPSFLLYHVPPQREGVGVVVVRSAGRPRGHA